ncbi:hypothetical protein DL93DRAFT_1447728 [Clavulina sp. PMI_390]|nr:hypothetical protein DL93DRAFT_1447728 [Clavulina sp. PMI_390]
MLALPFEHWTPLGDKNMLSEFCVKCWHNPVPPDSVMIFNSSEKRAKYPDRLLVRECYRDLIRFIETDIAQEADPFRGVVVTGQPGIGKTFFGWYCIRYQCAQGRPVLYHRAKKNFLFYDSHVYEPKVSATEEDLQTDIIEILRPELPLWCIIDMLAVEEQPSGFALDASWYPIQTTAPNPAWYWWGTVCQRFTFFPLHCYRLTVIGIF